MKNILVIVHDDAGQDARLQSAIDLTNAIEGHLTCLDLVVPYVEPSADPLYFETMVVDRDTETANSQRVRARLEAAGLEFSWIDRTGMLDDAIRYVAGAADLIVLSSPTAWLFPDVEEAAGAALIEAGTATLVVPQGASGLRVSGDVMLAWDGSSEANAAMHAAMPLLRKARLTTIVEIDDGGLAVPAAHALRYLEQRNVPATVRSDLAINERTGRLLIEQIGLLKADYVVMGAYGHPRLIERFLGGVTHRLLRDSPVPVFLKH